MSAAAIVAQLESRARAATTTAELGFSIANDCYNLLPFQQAMVLSGSGKQARLHTLSGLALPTEDSPYLTWLRRSWSAIEQALGPQGGWLNLPDQTSLVTAAAEAQDANPAEQLPVAVLDGWREWWPQGLYALPLKRRDGALLAWVVFLLEQPPTTLQKQVLSHMAAQWSYCWEMLGGKPRASLRQRWRALGRKRHLTWVAIAVLCLLPVRQSALAPAEIIALDATTIASPLDGVIQSFHVQPNQPVKTGDLLMSLDDTTLRNRLQVATQSVAVADAEWMAASQKAFDNFDSKSELSQLKGRSDEKRAELAAVQAQLARIEVRAPHAGIAVFGSADDWLGRPVVTGERILQVANPQSAGVLIYLPISDALVLEENAPVTLYLTVKPLSPLRASVTQTSYQATLSPDNISSYRLRATLDSGQNSADARIGLHGTAKISGDWVTLIYYLLRRPVAAAREWSGL